MPDVLYFCGEANCPAVAFLSRQCCGFLCFCVNTPSSSRGTVYGSLSVAVYKASTQTFKRQYILQFTFPLVSPASLFYRLGATGQGKQIQPLCLSLFNVKCIYHFVLTYRNTCG